LSDPAITVFIPVYNEAKIIIPKIKGLIDYMSERFDSYEVLIVENGSSDETLHLAKEVSETFPCIRIISIPQASFSRAIIEGTLNSKGEKVVWLGIDYASDIDFIEKAIKVLDSADVVLGSKRLGKDRRGFDRRTVNLVYNLLVRLIFKLRFADVEGYQAYRRSKVADLIGQVTAEGHVFNLEFLLLAERHSFIVKEVPIEVREVRESRYLTGLKSLIQKMLLSFREFIRLKRQYR